MVMIRLQLTETELNDIAEALDSPEVSDRAKKKLMVITMHIQGAKHGFIEGCLRISSPTLASHLKEYREGGLPMVLEDRCYRPLSALAPFWQCLVCSFKAAGAAKAKMAVARIESLSGITLSESQARRVMKRMGMSLKKAASMPAKANLQLQFDFYQGELKPRLEEASSGKRRVFFVDAAHFVLGAFLGMIWCFARPSIKTSPGRQRYSVLGAVDSHSKEIISIRTTGYINAVIVCELMQTIRTRYPLEVITLVLDNARYQHCSIVMSKAGELNVELLFLPTYSPNLNLIERLWKLVKKNCLINKYHESFKKFRAAIDKCMDELGGVAKPELDSQPSHSTGNGVLQSLISWERRRLFRKVRLSRNWKMAGSSWVWHRCYPIALSAKPGR